MSEQPVQAKDYETSDDDEAENEEGMDVELAKGGVEHGADTNQGVDQEPGAVHEEVPSDEAPLASAEGEEAVPDAPEPDNSGDVQSDGGKKKARKTAGSGGRKRRPNLGPRIMASLKEGRTKPGYLLTDGMITQEEYDEIMPLFTAGTLFPKPKEKKPKASSNAGSNPVAGLREIKTEVKGLKLFVDWPDQPKKQKVSVDSKDLFQQPEMELHVKTSRKQKRPIAQITEDHIVVERPPERQDHELSAKELKRLEHTAELAKIEAVKGRPVKTKADGSVDQRSAKARTQKQIESTRKLVELKKQRDKEKKEANTREAAKDLLKELRVAKETVANATIEPKQTRASKKQKQDSLGFF